MLHVRNLESDLVVGGTQYSSVPGEPRHHLHWLQMHMYVILRTCRAQTHSSYTEPLYNKALSSVNVHNLEHVYLLSKDAYNATIQEPLTQRGGGTMHSCLPSKVHGSCQVSQKDKSKT